MYCYMFSIQNFIKHVFYLVVCPPHWTFFDNNCWYSSSSTDTFDGARKTCQDEHLSAELASVHNAVDNWLLTGILLIHINSFILSIILVIFL